VVTIDQQDAVGLSQLTFESITVLREGRGVDKSDADILLGETGGRDGDGRQDRLDGLCDEGVLDQTREKGAFALDAISVEIEV
jgi:hypothetical protein